MSGIDEIHLKFLPGTTITEAMKEAWDRHLTDHCTVSFSFNGSRITIQETALLDLIEAGKPKFEQYLPGVVVENRRVEP